MTPRIGTAQIAPEGYAATEVYGYDGILPGPIIRVPQGGRVSRVLHNDLPVPTSVHWHGIRIDNAMDGVSGLTQEPVAPGDSFSYDFVAPDAGTYWYHAHTNSMEQVARGLYGPLIVEEAEAPDTDQDEILMLDDWLLDPDTAQIDPTFTHPMDLSHAGRYGNLVGTNGTFGYRLTAQRGGRLRLRLINAANARIFVLGLKGMRGWTMALDGMPLDAPEPVTGEIILAPAQRVDLIVDVGEDEAPALLRRDDGDSWQVQVAFDLDGERPMRASAPEQLPANSNMHRPDLASATSLEMRMDGGAMGNMPMGRMGGRMMDFGGMMQQGMYWTLDGVAGMEDVPFARLSAGEVVRLALVNDTAFPHAMHLHGMHFREVVDGTQGPMRDTILVLAGQTTEVAFLADNPGKWLLHCHMLEHAAAGMTTWIEVT